jgi:hypothetical protein
VTAENSVGEAKKLRDRPLRVLEKCPALDVTGEFAAVDIGGRLNDFDGLTHKYI